MQPDREQSEFNMAFAWLARLNYWFWSANEAKYNNDSYSWIKSLMVLFDELATEMKPEEHQQRLTTIKELYGTINKNITQRKQGIPAETYWELQAIDIWLRKLADKSGLLKKTKDDPSAALTG